MRRQYFILGPKLKKFKRFFKAAALKNVQVFNDELIFFGPPDSEASLLLVELPIASFPQCGKAAYTAWI